VLLVGNDTCLALPTLETLTITLVAGELNNHDILDLLQSLGQCSSSSSLRKLQLKDCDLGDEGLSLLVEHWHSSLPIRKLVFV
jgi:hypothetical protein